MKNILIKVDEQTHGVFKKAKSIIKNQGVSIERVIPYILEEALEKFIESPDTFHYLNGAGRK